MKGSPLRPRPAARTLIFMVLGLPAASGMAYGIVRRDRRPLLQRRLATPGRKITCQNIG